MAQGKVNSMWALEDNLVVSSTQIIKEDIIKSFHINKSAKSIARQKEKYVFPLEIEKIRVNKLIIIVTVVSLA